MVGLCVGTPKSAHIVVQPCRRPSKIPDLDHAKNDENLQKKSRNIKEYMILPQNISGVRGEGTSPNLCFFKKEVRNRNISRCSETY